MNPGKSLNAFVPIDSWWTGIEEWWRKENPLLNRSEVCLKLATVLYDHLVIPVSQVYHQRIIKNFSNEENVSIAKINSAWISINKFKPDVLIPKKLIRDVESRGILNKDEVMYTYSNGFDSIEQGFPSHSKLEKLFFDIENQNRLEREKIPQNRILLLDTRNKTFLKEIFKKNGGFVSGYYGPAADAVRSSRSLSWKDFGQKREILEEEIFGRIIAAIQSAELYSRVSSTNELAFLAFNKAHDYAINRHIEVCSDSAVKNFEVALGIDLPDFSTVSWKEIFEIRRTASIRNYRKYAIIGLRKLNNYEYKDAREIIIDALLELTDSISMKPGLEAIKVGAGLMPLPINPFSIALVSQQLSFGTS